MYCKSAPLWRHVNATKLKIRGHFLWKNCMKGTEGTPREKLARLRERSNRPNVRMSRRSRLRVLGIATVATTL